MSYNVLDDQSRNIEIESPTGEICDSLAFSQYIYASKSSDWLGPAWYRLIGPAGSRIPENKPGLRRCSTAAPSWIYQEHPTTVEETVNVTFCFDYDIDGIYDCRWPTEGKITNCKDFFVYYLVDTYHCSLRYCGID